MALRVAILVELATDADGRIVDPITTDTLLCDCAIHQVRREDHIVLLCTRHHHHIHKHELNLKLLPDATVEITWPDSHQRTSRPPGKPPSARAA